MIDHVYYINVEYRTERNGQFLDWIEQTNFPIEKLTRIDAVYTPENGYIGCALSHIKALEQFLESPHSLAIIHEDDYEPIIYESYWSNLESIITDAPIFDMLILAYTTIEGTPENDSKYIKLTKAFTTSGYVITRTSAPALLENLKEGIFHYLECYKQTGIFKDIYVLDVWWHQFMKTHSVYCVDPRLGKQRESYSDLQKKVVSYNG